jgi:hypothetical protein
LKAVLYAFQVRGMTYEVLLTQRIGDRVDATIELTCLVLIVDFFSSVHFAYAPSKTMAADSTILTHWSPMVSHHKSN